MGKEKESFIFYRSWLEAIDEASEIEQAHIYSAIAHYALNLKNPTKLKGIEKIVFLLAKPQIDANHRRYLNGQKGGAPKNNLNATKKQPRKGRQKERRRASSCGTTPFRSNGYEKEDVNRRSEFIRYFENILNRFGGKVCNETSDCHSGKNIIKFQVIIVQMQIRLFYIIKKIIKIYKYY